MTAIANSQPTPKVLALVKDLMFTAKILQAAKAAGTPVDVVSTAEALRRVATNQVAAILLDLNEASFNAIDLISELKTSAPHVKILGYASHVQGDLIRAAREAGCDKVLARSAFSEKLPELLRQLSDDRLD